MRPTYRLRRLRIVTALAFTYSTVFAGPMCYGWGATGHRAIGRIAERHLTKEAAAAVKELLGRETLAEASTFADEIRSDPRYDHTATWHYVTIEDGESYETSRKNSTGDVIISIRRFTATLRSENATKEEKVYALRWLAHLVGDIHQPLHVGRGDDRGGNSIRVQWFGDDTNLHTVWDSKMIDSTKLSFTELADFADKATEEQIKQWQDATVMDWVDESLKYRERAYKPPSSERYGSYKYSYENMPLVKLRLNQSGVRLAGLLNEVFAEERGGDE